MHDGQPKATPACLLWVAPFDRNEGRFKAMVRDHDVCSHTRFCQDEGAAPSQGGFGWIGSRGGSLRQAHAGDGELRPLLAAETVRW